nr:hypothetical protein [Tanacetum cinerariifolium]
MLECFNHASGLRINMNKSKLLGISVEDDKVKQAAVKIGCNTLKTPFSYLGSNMGGCMSHIQSWNERLIGWQVLHRIETMRSYFFNGAELSSKKSVWVKWKYALASKEKGGLGSSLWARVIKVLHGNDGKISRKVKSCYPSIWLVISHEVEMLKYRGIDLVSLIHSKLGNGANTSFWEVAWHGESAFKILFPRLYALETQKQIDVASKFSHSGLDTSFRHPPRGGVEQQQFEHLNEKVETIDDFMLPEVSSKTRWVKVVPITVNVHAWKVKLDGLPTRLNISRRGIDIESILCPICGKAVESTSHIFFTCEMSKEILRKISRWWDIDYMEVSSYEEWLDWILNMRLSVKRKQLLEGVCYVLWWYVWSFRNKCIFDSQFLSKAVIFDNMVSSSFNWCRYRCKVSFSWIEWLKNPHLIAL